ncbi:hypothetical protein L195_g056984, partial [Trifolium pratense]
MSLEEEEDWSAKLGKLPVVIGLVLISEMTEIAGEHDVVAAIIGGRRRSCWETKEGETNS